MDQHSTSDKGKEPPRPRTIPADFIWDPETESWYAPGTPVNWDMEAEREETNRIIEEARRLPPIPPEKLRVPPGTLDVPPAWRKSLGEERDLFSEVIEDDKNSEKEEPDSVESDDK